MTRMLPGLPVLRTGSLAAMLNAEFAGHPLYDALELQWFADAERGTGMLAFMTRTGSRVVDYYGQPGLRLDRADYQIGAGVGVWAEANFEEAMLEVSDAGVRAEAVFADAEGRRIEVRVDDRDGRRRRRGALLAPVSDGIANPTSLFLVWLPRFDLVRTGGHPPVFRIDGEDLRVGRLPAARLHRRHLIKYAAPVTTIEVLPDATPYDDADDTPTRHLARTIPASGVVECPLPDGATARLVFDPAPSDVNALPDGTEDRGSWSASADGIELAAGEWFAARAGERITAGLDVTTGWTPRGLPLLMRIVTTVAPVFRRWPTTYRWRADLGPEGVTTAGWERAGVAGGNDYRRATGT
jgi:hypothetical protein